MTGISLCAITRDEEERLPRMLDSVRGLVSEIVVVDTGSLDGTAEIARRRGARVIHHPFRDDFSEVRNVALAAAKQPWILVLDADEQLDAAAGPVIRRALRERGRAGFHLHFINDLGGGRQHVHALVRLFRNDRSIRFRYLIHEQILPDLLDYCRRRGATIGLLEQAVVRHDGYLPERARERGKDERNERLLRRQVERFPDQPYSWYKFGDFLRRFAERRAEAAAALERAAALLRAMDARAAQELSFSAEVFALLAVDSDRAGDPERALRFACEGRERFPATPNLLYASGHLLAKFGRHREAFAAYARLRALRDRLMAVPPEPEATGPVALFGMGRALVNLGHVRAGRRCLELSVAQKPRAAEPYVLLARLYLDLNRLPEALDLYREALRREPGDASLRLRLGAVLLYLRRPREALAEFRAAKERGAAAGVVEPRIGAALLALGEIDAARAACAAAGDAPEARAGSRLLELLAAGADPAQDPELARPAARTWLRCLALSPLAGAPAAPVLQGDK